MSYVFGKSRGPLIGRILVDLATRLWVVRGVIRGHRELENKIEKEIAEGKIIQSAPAAIGSEGIDEAVSHSLAQRRS